MKSCSSFYFKDMVVKKLKDIGVEKELITLLLKSDFKILKLDF